MEARETKTEFNAALASLMRLHQLLLDCNSYRTCCFENGYNVESLKKWKYTIDALYSEMYPKIKGSDKFKSIKKLMELYNSCGEILVKSNIEETSSLNPKAFQKVYKLNDIIEKKLRLFADQKGMLIPEKEDMWDELDEI